MRQDFGHGCTRKNTDKKKENPCAQPVLIRVPFYLSVYGGRLPRLGHTARRPHRAQGDDAFGATYDLMRR